jgi:hypothetical protein
MCEENVLVFPSVYSFTIVDDIIAKIILDCINIFMRTVNITESRFSITD